MSGFLRSTRIPRKIFAVIELTNRNIEQKQKNLKRLERYVGSDTLWLSSSVTVTVAEQCTWVSRPSRLIGISAFPTLVSNKLIEITPSIHTEKTFVSKTIDFFSSLDKETVIVQDRIGMVLPRILCQLINEAFFAVMEGIASPHEIDIAMKLGTNYPMGPLEWGNRIGLDNVYAVLLALQNDLREERYRIAPLLQQMAIGNKWWMN